MRTRTKSFFTILLLSIVCVIALTNITLAQQYITWTGNAGNNIWENAGNWSTNTVPTAKDTAYISQGSLFTLSISSNDAAAKLIMDSGTLEIYSGDVTFGIMTMNGNLTIDSGSLTLTKSATFSTTSHVAIGGMPQKGSNVMAELINAKGSMCSFKGQNLYINQGGELLNNGAWFINSNFSTSTDFTQGPGILVNNGNLWRYAKGNNQEVVIANDTLINNYYITNQSGTLSLNCTGIFHNASMSTDSNTTIKMENHNFIVKDSLWLTEGKNGNIILPTYATMTTDSTTVLAKFIPTHGEPQVNTALTLSGGKLTGSGKWINDISLILSPNSTSILGNIVNHDTLRQESYTSQLLPSDTIWNKGVIDLRSNGSINNPDMYHPGVIINDSLIQTTQITSNSSFNINPTVYNSGTLWAKSGTLNLSDTLYERGGRWMADPNAALRLNESNKTMYLSGTITGQSQGTISLYDNIYADTLQNVILDIGGNGAIMWTGTIEGPGQLTNKGVFAIKAGISIGIKTHFANEGDMTIANVGQSMAIDQYGNGYISNSGTLHLRDRADIRGPSKLFGKAMVVNTGTIVKDGDSGTATIGGLIDNSGKIEVSRGKLNIGNNWERNATISVADTAELDLGATMRVHGSVGGPILGKMTSNTTFSADTLQTATLRFTGMGVQGYGTTNFTGPGRWINAGVVRGTGSYLNFNHSLTNTGTLYLQGYTNIATGDTLYNEGQIILVMKSGMISEIGNQTPYPVILNKGTIKDDGETGYQNINIPMINQDTVRIDAGRFILDNSFDNQASGVITGTYGVVDENNNRTYISNEGGVYPYGPNASLTIQGPLDLSSPTSYLKFDLAGRDTYGHLVVTDNLTGAGGKIKIHSSGSFVPPDQSAYIVLSAPKGLPTTLPGVTTQIPYVHFTEAAQDTNLVVTAFSSLATIDTLSADTLTAGVRLPLMIGGSGFTSKTQFWIQEGLPAKPDSIVSMALSPDSLTRNQAFVSLDLRRPFWFGRTWVFARNPTMPADSMALIVRPSLNFVFYRDVGHHGVAVRNNAAPDWMTTRVYEFSNASQPGYALSELVRPRRLHVHAEVSSRFQGSGSILWNSNTSVDPDHSFWAMGMNSGHRGNLYMGSGISPQYVRFRLPLLSKLASAQTDSLIPFHAHLAFHLASLGLTRDQYALLLQRCLQDTANTGLYAYISGLSNPDSLLGAAIDTVLSHASRQPRTITPVGYLRRVLMQLAPITPPAGSLSDLVTNAQYRFTSQWVYQANRFIWSIIQQYNGAISQTNSPASQLLLSSATSLYHKIMNSDIPGLTSQNYGNLHDFITKFGPNVTLPSAMPPHPANNTSNNRQDHLYGGAGLSAPATASDCIDCATGSITTASGARLYGGFGFTRDLLTVRSRLPGNGKATLTSYAGQVDTLNGLPHVDHYYIPVSQDQDSLRYVIHFENPATASASVQNVTITDTLDPHLDPTSFRLMSASHDSILTVQRSGNILTFTYKGINLSPDTVAPGGEGYVAYSVKPDAGLSVGTTIRNRAAIIFDGQPAIMTGTLTHLVTRTADANLTLSNPSDSLVTGQTDSLSLAVSNDGPDRADSARVLVLIPSGVSVKNVTGATSWNQAHDSLWVQMGQIPAMGSALAKLALVTHTTGTTTFAGQIYTQSADPDIFNDQTLLQVKTVQGTPIEHTNSDLPDHYTLSQNYPNPFNPTTTIHFALPKAGQVRLEIYNILGQKVATLIDKPMKAGFYNVQWDARQAASGLYLYRIVSGHFVKTKKMMLIK